MWIAIVALVMHPVHASLSEVQWNAQTRRIEASLRLAPSDAEFILKRSRSAESMLDRQSVDPQRGPRSGDSRLGDSNSSIQPSAIALDYLARRFRMSDSVLAGDSKPSGELEYRWIGEEVKNGYVWWHFEIVPADHLPPKQWTVTLLLDRESNYQHRMVVLGLGRPAALDFSASTTRLSSDFWKR